MKPLPLSERLSDGETETRSFLRQISEENARQQPLWRKLNSLFAAQEESFLSSAARGQL